MELIHAVLKDINQGKDKELLRYYYTNTYLINGLLNNITCSNKDIYNDVVLNSIKGCLPEAILKKTLELINTNQLNNSPIKDCINQLIIGKNDWELHKVGNNFSVVIPFINKTVRLPIKVIGDEPNNTLMELINNKLVKGNMYIHILGSEWKVCMELY